MAYQQTTLSVSSLRLDLSNSRLGDGIIDQTDAIRAMCADKKKRREILTLARSIVDLGGLDPSTLPVVTVEDGQKVVLEGNRRVTCLKLLNNPRLAPEPVMRKEIERLAERGATPDRIRVIMYDSREEYDDFLEMRHTGENGGAGLKPWSSAESTRFKERRSGKSAIHTALLRWAEEGYQDDPDMLALITQVREQVLTTLKRFLMTTIRPELGLSYKKTVLSVEFTHDQLRPFLFQLFNDLLHGRTPRDQLWSRANKDDVLAYVEEHRHLLPSQSEKNPALASAAPPASPVTSGPKPSLTTAQTQSTPNHVGQRADEPAPPADSQHYGPKPINPPSVDEPSDHIFPNVDFTAFGDRIGCIGQQAQDLSIKGSPDVCGVMLRVLLDLTATQFLKSHGKDRPEEFASTVREAIKIIDPKIENRKRRNHDDLVAAFGEFGTHGADRGFAALRLHDMVHSTSRVTSANEIRQESKRYESIVCAMQLNLQQDG